MFRKIRRYLGPIFHKLSRQKNYQILEGFLMSNHVQMCISIPPEHSVTQVIGYIEIKGAISVARQIGGKNRIFNGERLWARGYAVTIEGYELEKVKAYIRKQEELDKDDDENAGGDFSKQKP